MFKIYTWNELRRNPPPKGKDLLVRTDLDPDGWAILPASGMMQIFGAPNAGKSLLAVQLGRALAAGGDTLYFRATQKCRVLYLLGEATLHGLYKRITRHDRQISIEGTDDAERMHLAHEPYGNFLDKDWLRSTVSQVLDIKADVVIVDPAANFYEGDENNGEHAKKWGRASREFVDQTGAALIVIHHAGKDIFTKEGKSIKRGAGASRGHTAFSEAPWDSIFQLSYLKDEKHHVLNCWKVREGKNPLDEKHLKLRDEDLFFEDLVPVVKQQPQEFISELWTPQPGIIIMLEKQFNISNRRARDILSDLENAGVIESKIDPTDNRRKLMRKVKTDG